MNQNCEFCDIEPLLIYYSNNFTPDWVHPYIKTWFAPDPENVDVDCDIHIISYDPTNQYASPISGKLNIIFKSSWVDARYEKFFNENDIVADKQAVYGEHYVNCKEINESMILTLTEDVYHPHPNVEFAIRNGKDYEKFCELYPSEQFIFTEVGEKVCKLLEQSKSFAFTSDCGISYDKESDAWEYST